MSDLFALTWLGGLTAMSVYFFVADHDPIYAATATFTALCCIAASFRAATSGRRDDL